MPVVNISGTALSEHMIPILVKIPEGEAVNPKVYGTVCGGCARPTSVLDLLDVDFAIFARVYRLCPRVGLL